MINSLFQYIGLSELSCKSLCALCQLWVLCGKKQPKPQSTQRIPTKSAKTKTGCHRHIAIIKFKPYYLNKRELKNCAYV